MLEADKDYVKVYKAIEYSKLRRKEKYNEERVEKVISYEEANNYLTLKKQQAHELSISIAIAFLAPVPLYLLLGLVKMERLDRHLAIIIWLPLLIILLSLSLYLSYKSLIPLKPFNYLKEEKYKLESYTQEKVIDFLITFQAKGYKRELIFSIISFSLAIISLALSFTIFKENLFLESSLIAVMLIFLGLSVAGITEALVKVNSYKRLLGLTKDNKAYQEEKLINDCFNLYWILDLGIFGIWTLISRDYKYPYLSLVLGLLIYPIYAYLIKKIASKKAKKTGHN